MLAACKTMLALAQRAWEGSAILLTSVACVVRLVPYSSRVGILLLLEPEPPPTLTVSWLSPTIRMTYSDAHVGLSTRPHNSSCTVQTLGCHSCGE